MPATIRISVLLPEPLRPTSPTVAPRGMTRLTSVSASTYSAGGRSFDQRCVSAVLSVVYPLRRTTLRNRLDTRSRTTASTSQRLGERLLVAREHGRREREY